MVVPFESTRLLTSQAIKLVDLVVVLVEEEATMLKEACKAILAMVNRKEVT